MDSTPKSFSLTWKVFNIRILESSPDLLSWKPSGLCLNKASLYFSSFASAVTLDAKIWGSPCCHSFSKGLLTPWEPIHSLILSRNLMMLEFEKFWPCSLISLLLFTSFSPEEVSFLLISVGCLPSQLFMPFWLLVAWPTCKSPHGCDWPDKHNSLTFAFHCPLCILFCGGNLALPLKSLGSSHYFTSTQKSEYPFQDSINPWS